MIDYVYLSDEKLSVSCKVQRLRAVEPHYHVDRIVLLLVLEGTLNLHAGSVHRILSEGEFAFVNMGEIHYTEETQGNKVLVVHVTALDGYYKNSKVFGAEQLMELKEKLLMLSYFYYMEELIEENEYERICGEITETIKEIFAVSEEQLVKNICLNFHKKITVESVGEKVGFNGRKVTSCLQKDELGGFFRYLMFIRCKAADKLILETNMKIKKISEITGFSSVRSFIREYTAYTGRTPLQQRKFYKEACKHKFNRINEMAPRYIASEICRYVGRLCISRCLEALKQR